MKHVLAVFGIIALLCAANFFWTGALLFGAALDAVRAGALASLFQ